MRKVLLLVILALLIVGLYLVNNQVNGTVVTGKPPDVDEELLDRIREVERFVEFSSGICERISDALILPLPDSVFTIQEQILPLVEDYQESIPDGHILKEPALLFNLYVVDLCIYIIDDDHKAEYDSSRDRYIRCLRDLQRVLESWADQIGYEEVESWTKIALSI